MRITDEWMKEQREDEELGFDVYVEKIAEVLGCKATDLEWFDSVCNEDTYEVIEDMVIDYIDPDTNRKVMVNVGLQCAWMITLCGKKGVQFCDYGLYGVCCIV